MKTQADEPREPVFNDDIPYGDETDHIYGDNGYGGDDEHKPESPEDHDMIVGGEGVLWSGLGDALDFAVAEFTFPDAEELAMPNRDVIREYKSHPVRVGKYDRNSFKGRQNGKSGARWTK